MFCSKLAPWNIDIGVLIDKPVIGVVKSDYFNLHEIICSRAARNFHKAKQLV